MPIVSKPREIRVQLDPDAGFPVSMTVESTRFILEDGSRVAGMPPHIEVLPPDSPEATAVIGDVASASAAALFLYQSEVQRLAHELEALREELARLR